MRDPRDEPKGEYLPRVGMPREDQRVPVARRLVVIDRLVIDEDSRGRRRRLARQFREALTAPRRVLAPYERQRVVDDARFVDERANLRFVQRRLNVPFRVVRRPCVRTAVVIPVDVVDSEAIFNSSQDRERLAHLLERRPFVDNIPTQDHEIRVFRVETFRKAAKTRRVCRQSVVKIGEKDDLIPLRA